MTNCKSFYNDFYLGNDAIWRPDVLYDELAEQMFDKVRNTDAAAQVLKPVELLTAPTSGKNPAQTSVVNNIESQISPETKQPNG